MDKLKQWVALSLVAVLAVLGAGWTMLVSPKRGDAQALRDEAATQASSNDQLRTQIASLKAQAKDLPKEQARLAAVAAKLPETVAEPALLRALAAAASGAGVEFVSVTPGAVTPVQGGATATPVAAAPADASAGSAAASGAATATGAAAAPAVPVAGGSTAGAGRLLALPLTISAAGSYVDLQAYLAALEDLPRALRVTGLQIAPGVDPVSPTAGSTTAPAVSTEDGRHLVAAITALVFLAPGSTSSTPVAVPSAAPVSAETGR